MIYISLVSEMEGTRSQQKLFYRFIIKKAKNNTQVKTIHPSMIKQIQDEIKFITEQQKLLKSPSN